MRSSRTCSVTVATVVLVTACNPPLEEASTCAWMSEEDIAIVAQGATDPDISVERGAYSLTVYDSVGSPPDGFRDVAAVMYNDTEGDGIAYFAVGENTVEPIVPIDTVTAQKFSWASVDAEDSVLAWVDELENSTALASAKACAQANPPDPRD